MIWCQWLEYRQALAHPGGIPVALCPDGSTSAVVAHYPPQQPLAVVLLLGLIVGGCWALDRWVLRWT